MTHLCWGGGTYRYRGQSPVFRGIHHSIVGQQAQVRLSLLQLYLSYGGGVLAGSTVVGVRVEDSV